MVEQLTTQLQLQLQQSKTEGIISITNEEEIRIQKLENKKLNQSFELAFCGHFSAGKSTILNQLLGANVLPTSPIPTSANVIEIKNGIEGLAVYSRNEEEKVWRGEIPWDKVREWGMNGHEISKMTITAPLAFLGDHSSILDTPGVDSTDESHESITVEQLYTTDAIVYVMDYNHVQSETNLYFLKQLSIEKKPIYIVINQIDKHNENEIPFSLFKKSVENVFQSWEIHYLGLYFTSMKNQEHHLNQFPILSSHLKALLYQSKQLMNGSQLRLEHGFYQAVKNRLLEEKQELISELVVEMKQKGYEWEQLEEKQQLTDRLAAINDYENKLWDQFNLELGKLFTNVTLFPALTTDLAREWIESLQPGFKVGLFFTKKKTIEEQENRLNKLVDDLQSKVKSQLLFHIQSFFQKVDRLALSNQADFEAAYENISFQVTKDLLKDHVVTNHSSREYVFTYTGEMTKMIIKDLRAKAQALVNIQIKGMKEFYEKEAEKVNQELEKFKEIEYFALQIKEIENKYNTHIETIKNKLIEFPSGFHFNEQILKAMQGSLPIDEGKAFTNISLSAESVIETEELIDHSSSVANTFSEEDAVRWLTNVKDALLINEATTILSNERNHLLERIGRYKEKTFIISLFGAFSAGKSSFANALLGENVLPVSPNPTTATVSTVTRSTKDHPHGTAVVYVKPKQRLDEEIQAVGEQLDLKLTIDNIANWNPNLKQFISNWQKTYAEYLLTIKESISTSDWKLGSQFSVTQGQLQDLVANESKACLIDKVTIYFDAPITEQGIVLVDTPGVNSIHGRHTNVAFTQMRTSDAIFYLTYYNHAFSKADQYFLQQMGKVNESFKHDKLYFVINASDLAESQGELNGVRKHVYDQLVKNGIEKPRLYHLSSKQGLEAKKERSKEETTFSQFEQSFNDYTILELKQLSVNMIVNELTQFVDKMNDSIAFMNEEKDTQLRKHDKMKHTVSVQKERVKKESFQYALRDVIHEFEQLIVYLQERMRFVLNDYFTPAINVSVLTGNNKKQLQEQLEVAIKEWRSFGELFLKQELEATVIRIEEAIKQRAKKWLIDQVKIIQGELPFLYIDDEFELEPMNIDLHDLHLTLSIEKYLPYVKSKKDFFEDGKVKELKEVLVSDGTKRAGIVIEESRERYVMSIEQNLTILEDNLKTKVIEAIYNELNRFETLLDPTEKNALQKEYIQLQKFII